MLFQGVQQLGRKAEIALPEFLRVLRTVDAGKIKYKIAIGAERVQLLRRIAQIVFIEGVDAQIGTRPVLAVPDGFQVFDQISPDKAFGAGDQDIHGSFLHTILLITPT